MMAEADILEQALAWHQAGRAVALATVIDTWGSAPRPVGSHMIIDQDGAIEGSVSGGCVEGAVVVEALEAIEAKSSRIVEYGVSDEDAFGIGLACGGTIRILIEPIGTLFPEELLQELLTRIADKTETACLIDLETGSRQLTDRDQFTARFKLDKSGIEADEKTFVRVYNPPLRLVITGAVHIAQYLVRYARESGFDVTLVDPRSAFATEARFPDTSILHDWPDDVLDKMQIDRRTAVVTLTHDPKIDDAALKIALKSDAFYIGSLGSKRTHQKRVERLADEGFDAEQTARIHGPIGLNIGGKQPAEIAVSIVAELIQTLRR